MRGAILRALALGAVALVGCAGVAASARVRNSTLLSYCALS